MPGELSHFHEHQIHGGSAYPEHTEPNPQKEALKRALDQAQHLRMETGALPPDISHIIELLCRAQESLIEAQHKVLRPPERWDSDSHFSARKRQNLKNQAFHQLEAALRELNPEAHGFIDATAEQGPGRNGSNT